MPLVLGVDIGTTTISALALDPDGAGLVALNTIENDAETTSDADRAGGRSEWDAEKIALAALRCAATTVEQLGPRRSEVAAIGLTGQQHGGLLLGTDLRPSTPLINWQDRRSLDLIPGSDESFVDRARRLVGDEAPRRAGCRLSPGYLAVILFWLNQQHSLPRDGSACFISEYFGSLLTAAPPASDPTMAGSAGVMNVAERAWDEEAIAALQIPRSLMPTIVEADQSLGGLCPDAAEQLGLPAGLPVFPALGDNQASFVGGVADPDRSLLVNVGTGGQVAARSDRFSVHPLLETRPFPFRGNLLVNAGLCGGRSYALLEGFLQDLGRELFDVDGSVSLYRRMGRLAEEAEPRTGGMRCQPLFTGTRAEPDRRGEWTGVSPENLTPANFVRSLLEGIVDVFHEGYDVIRGLCEQRFEYVVGAGNGLRENGVLADCLRRQFGLPLRYASHREEAATGAALAAAVGAGLKPDLAEACRWIRYTD